MNINESIKNPCTPDNNFNLKWIDGYPVTIK